MRNLKYSHLIKKYFVVFVFFNTGKSFKEPVEQRGIPVGSGFFVVFVGLFCLLEIALSYLWIKFKKIFQ